MIDHAKTHGYFLPLDPEVLPALGSLAGPTGGMLACTTCYEASTEHPIGETNHPDAHASCCALCGCGFED